MTRTFRAFLFFAVCVTVPFNVAAAEAPVEVITLKHRPAADVIPLIQPFLAEDSALSGTGFELIVRTSPDNLQEIQKIISRVDVAPRQLLISVMQTSERDGDARRGEISGSAPVGGNAQVKITGDDGEVGDKTNVKVNRTADRDSNRDMQQVRVLEGHVATIRVGQTIPVETGAGRHSGTIVGSHATFEYKEVSVGFDVLPRVNGDQVTIDIRPQRSEVDETDPDTINVQQLQTTVAGHLGEWIDVGGVSMTEDEAQRGTLSTARARKSVYSRILLRVTELD